MGSPRVRTAVSQRHTAVRRSQKGRPTVRLTITQKPTHGRPCIDTRSCVGRVFFSSAHGCAPFPLCHFLTPFPLSLAPAAPPPPPLPFPTPTTLRLSATATAASLAGKPLPSSLFVLLHVLPSPPFVVFLSPVPSPPCLAGRPASPLPSGRRLDRRLSPRRCSRLPLSLLPSPSHSHLHTHFPNPRN